MDQYITRPEHEEFVRRMEDEHHRLSKRISDNDKALEQFTDIAISVEKMAMNMERMLEEQKKQGARLEELEKAPAKRWEKLISGIIGAIAGVIGSGLVAAVVNNIQFQGGREHD